jgi:NodT family efflux transporter outer membrane factor (OMF) lipoprotein
MFPVCLRKGALLAPLAAVMLYGCAAGPDFKRPEAPAAQGYANPPLPINTASAFGTMGGEQQFDVRRDIPFDWWTLFRCRQLNSLIDAAFKSNPTIESARAALNQAEQNVVIQQGFFYPSIGIDYSPSRNKLAGNNGGNSPGVQNNGTVIQTYSNPAGPAPYNAPVYYNFHVAQLTVGYVPDVFGANRRQAESARALAENQNFQLEATYITLASNVVAAAIQEASLRAQITAMKRVVDLNRQILDIDQKRHDLGDISGLDLAAQQAATAQAEQGLFPLQRNLEQTRDLIKALAGRYPSQDLDETFELSSLHLPEKLPLSLPSRLVEQRPDVRAAEAQLHYASAEYGVAIANRLPQFSVTGAVGGMASSPDWMFRAGGGFFNLAADISYTLFDGGALRAKSRAAREALAEAGAEYRSTVIAALQNVADTLHALQSDAGELKAAADAERAARKSLKIAQGQYQAGDISYPALLQSKQSYQIAAISLAQAQASRLGDTAALYQALGGGWWNRPGHTASFSASEKPLATSVSVTKPGKVEP